MDVNKIVLETINNVSKNNESAQVITENQSVNNETEEHDNSEYISPLVSAIPSAISAGLGAVCLRNKIRNISKE